MSSLFAGYRNLIFIILLIMQAGLMGWYIADRFDTQAFKAQVLGEEEAIPTEFALFEVPNADLTRPYKQPDLEPFYRLMFSSLVIQQEGRFQPDLAASFTLVSTENGRDVWNFRLNPSATFASGRAVNTTDVTASLSAALPTTPGLTRATWKAIDQSNLEIRTTDANLLDTLAHVFIEPLDARTGELIGSGPYQVLSVESPDISITEIELTPRKNFHRVLAKSPLKVSLFTSPYRLVARAITHILHEEKMELHGINDAYLDAFRPHCNVDSSRSELEGVFDAICDYR